MSIKYEFKSQVTIQPFFFPFFFFPLVQVGNFSYVFGYIINTISYLCTLVSQADDKSIITGNPSILENFTWMLLGIHSNMILI